MATELSNWAQEVYTALVDWYTKLVEWFNELVKAITGIMGSDEPAHPEE